MPKKKNLSRRDFLKISFTALWGAILAACNFSPEEEPIPTTTPTSTTTNTPKPKPQADSPTPEPEPTETSTPTSTPEPCFSLLKPTDRAELGNIGRVAFVWEEQNGAASYKLVITLPNELIEEYETELTRFEKYLESLPMAGEYHWFVIAYDTNGDEVCQTDKFTFRKLAQQKNNGGRNGNNNDGSDDEVFGNTH